jgi:hypothetical protein
MFFVMSNELNTPKILFCPTESADTHHFQSTTWLEGNYTNDANVSYFVAVDADSSSGGTVGATGGNSRVFLSGDRFMGPGTVSALPVYTAIFNTLANFCEPLGTGSGVAWASDVGHGTANNVVMTDGSVTAFSIDAMQSALANSGDTTHTAITSPGTFGAGINRMQFPAM